MAELLVLPLKRASDIDVQKPLKHLIQSTSSSSSSGVAKQDKQDLADKLRDFQKLRQETVRNAEQKGEAALNAVANYYDQIASLEQKIPAAEVQIPFKWRDAFNRGSLFGGRISLTVPSLAYEKVCVLFNVGALCSGVAAEQNVQASDGQQKALKRLQLAAGIFQHLKDTVVGLIQQDPTPDLEPDTLGVLSELMLAQAQEMVVQKALSDNMKDAIVAKLCSQCEDLFAQVMRSMQRENVRGIWESHWLPNVCGKQAIYNGMAQYHQSRVCNAAKNIGEEIARLEFAKTLFTAGQDRGSNSDLCRAKEWLRKTERALTDAKKDNDFIYHERVPEAKTLSAVAKAAVAKPTLPLPSKLGTMPEDLFESLCPVAIHQALSAYEARKNDLVNAEVVRMKDATNMLNQMLSSMNLPAALEDTSGSDVPQSLKDKASAVYAAGGSAALLKLVSDLPDLLSRNTEILDECERLLREERESDEQLRTQFKEKWTRTPSGQLTGTFNANATKYRTIINNAKQADSVVKDKLETHKGGLEILSKGPANLASAIPQSGAQSVKGSPTVTKLKALMEDIETLKAERQVVESEIKNANADMRSVFFEALNKNNGVIPEHEISTGSLGRQYGPLQKQVNENLSRQESLIKQVQENNDRFVQESGKAGGGSSANERDTKQKQLAAAHDAFFELKGNLQEGTKFYNDLTQLLVTFQNKVSDFCFARKTEKDELMKDLTSGMASMALSSGAGATATPPAHHAAAAAATTAPAGMPERPPRKADNEPEKPADKSAPPARPPQPAVNPYAGAPAAAAVPTSAAPAAAPNPYAGAPPGANPYGNAPYPQGAPQGMPMAPNFPVYNTPMPAGYNPYGYAPQQQPGYPPQGYPPQGYAQPGYQPYPGYPPQAYPPQGYPPQQQQPPQQPPQQ